MKKALIAIAVVALMGAVYLAVQVAALCTGHPHGMC